MLFKNTENLLITTVMIRTELGFHFLSSDFFYWGYKLCSNSLGPVNDFLSPNRVQATRDILKYFDICNRVQPNIIKALSII